MVHRKFMKKQISRKGKSSPQSRQQIGAKLVAERQKILLTSKMMPWEGIPPPFPRAPRGCYPGSTGIVKQITQTFTNSSGLTTNNRLVASNSAPLYWAIAFTPTDLPGISSLAAAFDAYRVEKVHYRFTPYSNAVNTVGNSSTQVFVPNLGLAIDHDDSTAPSAVTEILQYDTCQIVPGYAGISVEFVPAITQAVYASGAFSGYTVIPSNEAPPIDLANLSVPHYGLKGYVDQLSATSTSNFAWTVTCSATVSFFAGR